MSYQVFARKYRPQTFDEVVGQDHIVRTLRNAIELNRLAHAYLFVGPRGTGKTSTARIIAKALNCLKGPTTHPCGECDVCREIANGTALDVIEIDGASNNSVEQVRELRENVRFAPARGKFKIYIIDEVHMLTTAAFNALLKTLEEPPPHVKFIFATTEPQKVLPTILSRCQRFDLRRIPAQLIAQHLLYIAGKEGIDLDQEAAEAVARGADGGLRDAESMLDQLVAFCGEKITAADVQSVFGFVGEETIGELCQHLLERNASPALAILHRQAEEGRDLMKFLSDLITHLRNLLVYKADPKALSQEAGSAMFQTLEAQATLLDNGRLLDLIDLFAATENRMKWAPNKRLHFEVALIKAIQLLGQTTLTDVIETLESIRSGKPQERPARNVPPPAASQSTPAPAKPEGKSRFELLREAVSPKAAPQPAPSAPKPEPTNVLVAEPAPSSLPSTPAESRSAAAALEVKTAPPRTEPSPTPSVDLESGWKRVLELARKKPIISMVLGNAVPLELKEGTLRIGFAPDQTLAIESLSREQQRANLESMASDAFGTPLKVAFELREDIAATLSSRPAEEQKDTFDPETFKNDELIKRALDLFRAEIQGVTGSLQNN